MGCGSDEDDCLDRFDLLVDLRPVLSDQHADAITLYR